MIDLCERIPVDAQSDFADENISLLAARIRHCDGFNSIIFAINTKKLIDNCKYNCSHINFFVL